MRKTRSEEQAAGHEAVARRAYELFEERGRAPGREVEDWLEAEQQLRLEGKPKPARKKTPTQLA